MQVRASGMIVNSMGWIVELGYELLKHTMQASWGQLWWGREAEWAAGSGQALGRDL